MACGVHAQDRWEAIGENGIEIGNIGAAQENIDILLSQSWGDKLGINVTTQLVRFVVEISGIVVEAGVEVEADRSIGNRKVGKRARSDRPASRADWKIEYFFRDSRYIQMGNLVRSIWNGQTIARQTVRGAVEQWGGFNVFCVQSPIPVPVGRCEPTEESLWL